MKQEVIQVSTNLDQMDILKKVESGQLSAAEALTSLSAPKPQAPRTRTAGKPRWLRVRVMDLDTGRPKVNVNMPMNLLQVGLAFGARFVPELDDVDLQSIFSVLDEETAGKIVEVEDVEDGERVEVYIE